MDSINPVELLEQLASQSQGNTLVEKEEIVRDSWRGFTFSIEEIDLVVPFVGEFEIVPSQALTPIPMTKSWVKGMTNIRGEIYSVIDFAEFIGRQPVRMAKGSNFLVLPDQRLKSALLLDGRISLQSFYEDLPTVNTEALGKNISPYLNTVLQIGEKLLGVLDINLLIESDRFTRIGK